MHNAQLKNNFLIIILDLGYKANLKNKIIISKFISNVLLFRYHKKSYICYINLI
jgi:hypothetical protein